MVALLKRPRRVMLMVKAGSAVDEFIEQLLPHLEPGDIIIDGGNSLFDDTARRVKYVESKGLLYIGTGVSGGEEGARFGPSIMPGGSPAAFAQRRPIFLESTLSGEPDRDDEAVARSRFVRVSLRNLAAGARAGALDLRLRPRLVGGAGVGNQRVARDTGRAAGGNLPRQRVLGRAAGRLVLRHHEGQHILAREHDGLGLGSLPGGRERRGGTGGARGQCRGHRQQTSV